MSGNVAAARAFTEADQAFYAAVSGDCNPMHLDALAARRTQAGAPVVHGVHAVLWVLDELARGGVLREPLAALDVEFRRFIYVGVPAELRFTTVADGIRASVWSEGLNRIDIVFRFTRSAAQPVAFRAGAPLVETDQPLDLNLEAVAASAGRMTATIDPRLGVAFPSAAAYVGAQRLQAIARLSTLVGMVCPGLHSIFDGFALELTEESNVVDQFSFAIATLDDRFRRVVIEVAGSGIAGTVTAFVRYPPVQQPGLAEAAAVVAPGEFAGVTALVVGGSRGLGAMTARLIVAGGGRALVTYRVGRAEALELVAELGEERCRSLPYDALEPAAPQLADLPWPIDQAYYFATTQIFREQGALFSPARFAELCAIYVVAFEDLAAALAAQATAPLALFYPSSVAVAERPRKMTEYSMAKAAAEVLCSDLDRALKRVKILVERLPRVLTDQTSSVVPAEATDALTLMLPLVRRMTALVPPAAAVQTA
jgi:acyl dehydratase